MKIVFFSDAHGNHYVVKEMFRSLTEVGPDMIVFGGDIFGYYYGQEEIIAILRENACICLMGNHDKYFLDLCNGKVDEDYLVERYGSAYSYSSNRICQKDIEWLQRLKSRYDLEIDNIHLAFAHGSLADPLEGRIYKDTAIDDIKPYEGIDYVFCGHTHHKLIRQIKKGTTLINAGSIGQQRDGTGCSYILFDTKSRKYEIKETQYDREKLVREIKNHHETAEMERRLIEVLYRKNTVSQI